MTNDELDRAINTAHGLLRTTANGKFESDSDHDNRDKAARRVNYLNGGEGKSYQT